MRLQSWHLQAGAGRLGFLLLLFCVSLLWGGGQGVYTAVRNPKPAVMTMQKFLKEEHKETWLQLTDAVLDIPGASFKGRGSLITEAFVPVRAKGQSVDAKVSVILSTSDTGILALIREMKAIGNEQDALSFVLKNRERLYPERSVNGIVQFGIELKDRDREKLAGLNSDLASDFIIISDGKSPELAGSIAMLAGGMLTGFAMFWLPRSNRAQSTPPPLPTSMPPPLPS